MSDSFNNSSEKINRFERATVMDMEQQLPEGDANCELHGEQLLRAEREAAGRLGGAIEIQKVIEQTIVRDNNEWPVSSPARVPAPATPERASTSTKNSYMLPFLQHEDSFEEKQPDRPVQLTRRPPMEFDDENYKHTDTAEPKPLRR